MRASDNDGRPETGAATGVLATPQVESLGMYYRIGPYDRTHLAAMLELYNEQAKGHPHIARLTEVEFAELVEAKSYFDPQGLMVATGARRKVLGWVHACVAAGSESWQKPEEAVARIRMLVFSPENLGLGTDLVRRATQWLAMRGHKSVLAMHAKKGYPFYRGLWYGFEPMCPVTLPHLHMALEVAGYKITQQSIFMTAKMKTAPRPPEAKIDAEFESGPATMAHEPMRQSWAGFEPRTITVRVRGAYAGAIHWAMQPHLATTLGAACMNIWGLGVHDNFRRKGLAIALIGRAMAEAYERGARFASVGTQLWNAPAHQTYAKMGYVPDTVMMGRELNAEAGTGA